MQELPIKRNLNDDTRKQGVVYPDGEVYSLHITDKKEVIITDFSDYTKIYAIYTLEFFYRI